MLPPITECFCSVSNYMKIADIRDITFNLLMQRLMVSEEVYAVVTFYLIEHLIEDREGQTLKSLDKNSFYCSILVDDIIQKYIW